MKQSMMKPRIESKLAQCLAGMCALAAVGVQAGELAQVETLLRTAYPATKIDSVEATPINGIYKVAMGRNQAFVDATGKYFLFGRMYDMEKQEELYGQEREAAPKIDVAALPLDKAIKSVRGSGARVLAVFSDPDCPYCKKLERELAQVDNVTVYTFLMPLDSLHPDARRKSVGVWCSADRARAWDGLMLRGEKVADGQCDAPIDEIAKLAESLGIQGTPFLIAGDGRAAPGAMPADRLSAWLDAASRVAAAEGGAK